MKKKGHHKLATDKRGSPDTVDCVHEVYKKYIWQVRTELTNSCHPKMKYYWIMREVGSRESVNLKRSDRLLYFED